MPGGDDASTSSSSSSTGAARGGARGLRFFVGVRIMNDAPNARRSPWRGLPQRVDPRDAS